MSHTPISDPAADFLPLAHYAVVDAAFEESLVVLAMGHACQIDPAPEGGFLLMADPAAAAEILRELECYRAEQAVPPPQPPPLPDHGSGGLVTAFWILLLAYSFSVQDAQPQWTEFGLSSSQRLWVHGEWWRPFTALFLHADVPHLLGNILSGSLFATWVCRSVGALRGWPLALLAGTLGNLCNAAVHYGEEFRSLGASTAVFGALGVLTGHGLRHGFHSWRGGGFRAYGVRRLLPLLAGLALLGMTGAGEAPRTDVAGHFFGFLAGLALGIPFGHDGVSQRE
ncbi:MAG: rhomboid family intramembrane serine protease [Akkermansiaceae bacterium]|nr:rhomboid family intramembrane serine protease [Akkermansiaceae bacterium]